MLYGHLSAPDAYAHLLLNPVWRLAFEWLKTVTPATPAGIRRLQGEDVFANIHGYDTLSRKDCRFESHRRHIDLQYCISGGELIDWRLASGLAPDGGYDAERDLQFYRTPASCSSKSAHSRAGDRRGFPVCALPMSAGSFAIFHPSDAHRPKERDGIHRSVFKLVIKLDRSLCDGPAPDS
jgi:YhcH/YjgK/YiaL family protein